MLRGRPLAPLAAQVFLSGRPSLSGIVLNATGSIIWPIIPSPRTITGLRYFSARWKASMVRSTASCTVAGASTSSR